MLHRQNPDQQCEPANVGSVRQALEPLAKESRNAVAEVALGLYAGLQALPTTGGLNPWDVPRIRGDRGYGDHYRFRWVNLDGTGAAVIRPDQDSPAATRKYSIPGYDGLYAYQGATMARGKSLYLPGAGHIPLPRDVNRLKAVKLHLLSPSPDQEDDRPNTTHDIGIRSDGTVERSLDADYLTSDHKHLSDPETAGNTIARDFSSRLAVAGLVAYGLAMIYGLEQDTARLGQLHARWHKQGAELPYQSHIPFWAQHAECHPIRAFISLVQPRVQQ